MEIVVYLLGNWCCIAAAFIVISYYVRTKKPGSQASESYSDKDLMISFDLQIMLAIATCVRVYWSLSPPPIWSDEPEWIQWISKGDLFFSVFVWGACCLLSKDKFWTGLFGEKAVKRDSFDMDMGMGNDGGMEMRGMTNRNMYNGQQSQFGAPGLQKSNSIEIESPLRKYMRWPVLTLAAAVVAFLGSLVLPTLHTHGAWPMVDFAVIFNMFLDGFAMIPQVILIAYSDKLAPPEASHFVGLLCLGRLLRMLFWGWLVLHPDSGHAIWTFVLPDLIHTIIMADYLHEWLKKVKRDRFDPFLNDIMHV